MKKLTTLLLFTTLFAHAQRIVGYFPSYRVADINTVQYTKLTDVIYCFLNPNTDGTLNLANPGDNTFGWDNATFTAVKAKCKPATSTGPRLIVSVGGADIPGSRAQRLYDVSSNATYRATFVAALVSFAATHSLYGVDIDWEFPTTTAAKNAHETLLADLRTAINASANPALKLGIAVGGEYSGGVNHLNYINTNAIQYVDDVNVMAYDLPSTYNADHSTRTDANASLAAWYNKGVPKSKLLLGLPFYGWANPRGSNPSEYDQNANYQNAFNNGFDGTYYYNSKTTIENKVADIMAYGGQGVFVWDLGQDRADPWSYLSTIKTKMDAVCPAPQPDLGVDINLCLPGTVVLNSQQDAIAGRTFVWKKDNVVIGGQTSPTLTVNSGGTYTVEITQSACTKTDDVFVNAGSPLTVTGASRCGSGQLTLSATGGPYQWYDASSAGNLLATASTYSPTISTTTTYYVQPNSGSTNYNGGKAVINGPSAWDEAAYEASNSLPRFAHKVTISQATTLVSVNAYYGVGVTINGAKIMIISATNGTTVVDQTTAVNLPVNASPYTFSVNKVLAPGTYYIGVYAPVDPGIWLEPNTSYPSSQAGIFSMEGKCYANYGAGFNASQTPSHYGQLFAWVFAVGTVPACGRTPVTGTVTSAANQGLTITHNGPICSGNGTVTIANSESSVSYQAYIGASPVGTAANGNGGNLTLTIPAGNLSAGNNTITIKATASGCGAVDMTTQPVIALNSTPGTPGAFTTSSTSVCQSQLNVSYIVPAVAGVTYNWSYTGGIGVTFTGSTNSVTASFSAAATSGSINVTATNSCGTSSARTVGVTVNPAPSQPGAFNNFTPTVCQSTSGVAYSVPTSVDALNWTYSGTNTTINGSTNAVTLDFGAAATGGTLSVTSSNGCGISAARTLDITVNARPAQPGAFTAAPTAVTQGQNGVVYTIPNVGGVTYNWTFGGTGAAINGSGNSITVDFNGTATSGDLGVSASIGSCAALNSRSVFVTVSPINSIEDLKNLQGGLVAFPNPFTNETSVSLSLESTTDVQLTIVNASGQEILQLANGTLNAGEHSFLVNELPAGLYNVRLQKNGIIFNSKLIRQ